MGLTIERLAKSYGAVRAVDDVTFTVQGGERLALLGPSGCGKSTLLGLIAGLERPDAGRVFLRGEDVTDIPPQRRDLGMVFQDFALFPHLDVARNVAFGLVERRIDPPERQARVVEMLELVGLRGLGSRRVHELSGGQQQRVALARAMAPVPGLLLLDEPLSNLDEALRAELREEIVDLLDDLDAEAVYVTHDQVEAFSVADTVAVMREGRIVQIGTPGEVLASPADPWTARFLGHENVWEGVEAARVAEGASVPSGSHALLLRTDEVRLLPESSSEAATPATVSGVMREGLAWRLDLEVPAWRTQVRWVGHARELPLEPTRGARLALGVPGTAWHAFTGGSDPK